MQRIFILLIPAAAFLFHSCGTPASGKNTSMTNDTIPVQVMALDGPTSIQGIAVSGQYTTDDETLLSFKTGGVINDILVKEGDRVHTGQLLATLNLTEINTQVAQAQLGYEKAQRDYQRAVNLYKDSVATLEQFQNAKTALDIATEQMNAARFNLSYSEIHAPQDGYVLRKLANPGQVITSGTTVLQTNGAGGGNWMLRVGLSDREWAAIRVGDKARMDIDGQPAPGAVSRKSEGIDPVSGTFTADIRLTGPKPAALATGLFGKGVIEATDKAKTCTIPYQALLDGDGSTGFVFVTTDGKTAHKVKVVVEGMQKDKVQIADAPQGGVIISGSAYLTDGSPIRVTNTTELQ